MNSEKDFGEIIENLTKELSSCEESISRTKDEINTKRRTLSELQGKRKNIQEKVNAKRYEFLESIVSDKLKISIDELVGAVQNDDILVEKSGEIYKNVNSKKGSDF